MAKQWYLDASALSKRYVVEAGTPLINHLFNRVPRRDMMCLTLGTLEVVSIFVRKANAGLLPHAALNHAMTEFRNEVIGAAEFGKITSTDALVYAAAPLVLRHSINATDAVILRSALDTNDQFRVAGNDLVLVASDQRLLRAAQLEGLLTFNPETQTQTDLDALLANP